MLMMDGLVEFLPASHEGTGTSERVTITSAAGVGQPALAVMVVVTEGMGMGAADEYIMALDIMAAAGVDIEPAEYWLGGVRWMEIV